MNLPYMFCWIGLVPASLLYASPAESAKSASPADAERLIVMARDCLKPVEIQLFGFADLQLSQEEISRRIHQGCLYLEAALELDPGNTEAWRQLYPLYMTDLLTDPGRAYQAVSKYLTLNPRDSQTLESWISWRLPQFQDRDGREEFLKQILPYTQFDPVTRSRVLTQLGILAMEKGVYRGNDGAEGYLNQAAAVWPNNDDALARLTQLPPESPSEEGAPAKIPENQDQILRWRQISRWRSRLHNNPSDGQALLNLIDTLEQLDYPSIAARYYPYAMNLLSLFPDSQLLEYELRLKQIVNSYVLGDYQKCVTLAHEALQKSPQDILLSGVLIRTFQNLNQPDSATQWMEKTSRLILDKQASASAPSSSVFLEAAWYFSFIDPQPRQALALAQSGRNEAEKHPRAQAILAYAFLLNQMNAEAKQALADTAGDDPIGVLTRASLELAENNPQAARDTLHSLPAHKWAVLDQQRDHLQEEIQKALPAESPAAAASPAEDPLEQRFADLLSQFFPDEELSLPLHPEQSIHCSLRFTKDVFYYNDPLNAVIHLINTGKTELVLGPVNWIDPRILILAHVAPVSSGAASDSKVPETQKIPVSCEYLRQRQLLPPGESNSIPIALNIGPLRTLLQNHPQQSYQITFYLYIDPLPDGQGGWISRIPQIQPSPVAILRQAFRPNSKNLQFQLESIKQTAPEDNLRAAFLLAAILQESGSGASSSRTSLPASLQGILNPLRNNFQHSDFRVRAWTTMMFQNQPLPIVSPVMNHLMKQLDDPQWFVRFMAILTLDVYADLSEYLTWVQSHETHPVVLRLVQWKQKNPWKPLEVPVIKEDTTPPVEVAPTTPAEEPAVQP